MSQKYDVAAFIWPSYTGDEPRSRIFWPEGYGEWQTVKAFKGYIPEEKWPRKPLWGYVNEADPYVMEMEIEAAADHGVNVFIYDWYWFDGRPFLEQCLDNGYLKAKNNDKVKFYIMWANHTATSLWDKRTAELGVPIWDGAVDRRNFDIIVRKTIDMYFSHPSYYKIDGKPVLDVIDDEEWLKTDFIRTVRNRGSAVIEERGASSAASAASAIVDTVHSVIHPTLDGDFHSIGVCSDGSYGTQKGLITSMPIRSDGNNIEIVQGLQINDFARSQIDASVRELQEEADTFNSLAF